MKKEFVTYEQALALKELGFNEKCFGCYQLSELRDYKKGLEISHIMTLNTLNGYRIYDDETQTSAPLKSQVLRWFREKYNQNSFIELVYQDGIKYDYVLYADKDKEECGNFGDGPFNTYEEAENACIDKLLEIAKELKS
jgi:hypothetical protein